MTKDQHFTGNKGEWSELYTFLKILSDNRISAADSNLMPTLGQYFVFQKVHRFDDINERIYDISLNDIRIISTDNNVKLVSRKDLPLKTQKLFERIKVGKNAFSIPEITPLMQELECHRLKAGSSSKADLEAQILDRLTDTEQFAGFSIKSMVGAPATLLNPGKTTNFIFKVENADKSWISIVNEIETSSKLKDRMEKIKDLGGRLKFFAMESESFSANLKKIDTMMPHFIAQMLIFFFSKNGVKDNLSDLVNALAKHEEFQEIFGLSLSDYKYKIKNLLQASALGMVPSKIWDGFDQAFGGYLVVKDTGELVCYNLYRRDIFLTYLFENTKFVAASSGRYGYGKLYKDGDDIFLKLNLQIRFCR